ncbi:DNA-binding transcriptional regulator with homology to Lrp [Legionella israelensis]|nr:Lrp/AsnC family transcriptional regulator [Legionella israelensis]QBS11149.1 Lrp/AsnC family transcriptional regulator [Legionella israelensis]STX60065.1 DNA-binding transcriptional regulator with homology to Lrp [Legionella israelensis]
MDRIDKHILELLQQNSKISNQELADMVSLSPSPCLRRVKQLEDNGYIDRYVALLNPKKLGLELTIMVSVGLSSHDHKIMTSFEGIIKTFPEVVQCHLIAGQAQDYMLKVVVSSLNDYQEFLLNKLTQIEGVRNIHSSFVLRSIVDQSSLPLNQFK